MFVVLGVVFLCFGCFVFYFCFLDPRCFFFLVFVSTWVRPWVLRIGSLCGESCERVISLDLLCRSSVEWARFCFLWSLLPAFDFISVSCRDFVCIVFVVVFPDFVFVWFCVFFCWVFLWFWVRVFDF